MRTLVPLSITPEIEAVSWRVYNALLALERLQLEHRGFDDERIEFVIADLSIGVTRYSVKTQAEHIKRLNGEILRAKWAESARRGVGGGWAGREYSNYDDLNDGSEDDR